MRRRDISKLILASAGVAGSARTAAGASSTFSWDALREPGYIRVPDGTYHIHRKLQTISPNTIVGDSRDRTVLLAEPFDDYVLEVGNDMATPNAGAIQRMRFFGARGNLGCLHMNRLSHMWHLDELVFSGGPCPALVIDNCWDSNYTNIDIFSHIGKSADPANGASVIFRSGCNNIYCRGLRIEGALSGGLYVNGGPIYVVTGKIDDGAQHPQTAAAATVGRSGGLVLDDFYLGGTLGHFHIDVAGSLKLGKVLLDGGTDYIAAIGDHRQWWHANAESLPGVSAAFMGPMIGELDLGQAQFNRFHPSLETETRAAVYSKIYPIRQVHNLAVTAYAALNGHTIRVSTTLRSAHDELFKNSILVHNATGTEAGASPGARRRILHSSRNGDLVLQGPQPVILDGDWSIEYCAQHATPIRYRSVSLEAGLPLFATVCAPVRITSGLTYISQPSESAYGSTAFEVSGDQLARARDLQGLYLIDDETGEPYYIQYGLDARHRIGIIYDRTIGLDTGHTFSIVAGYAADVDVRGGVARWYFAGVEHRARVADLSAYGYSSAQVPLWAFRSSFGA